jgi:hypothetical protein
MNKVITPVLGTSLLVSALAFAGCSQPEVPNPATAPTTATATPKPTEVPKVTTTESLTKAKESLTKAVGELKDKNYRGAQDLLTVANTHLAAAAASAPAPVKAGIDKALATIAGVTDIKTPTAEKTLSALVTSVTALIETTGKAEAAPATAPKK